MFLALAACLLNDGGLTWGGSPTLLETHPSVAMQREVIRLKITKNLVTTDCSFDFYNDGAACDVRMGFPDKGEGANDPYEAIGDDEWPSAKLESVFGSFQSWVNGKRTKCELVKGKKIGELYWAKTVHFPARSHMKVRDLYTMPWGGGVAFDGNGYANETGYILHTGASWKGKIGSSKVIVQFGPGISAPMECHFVKDSTAKPYRFASFHRPDKGLICYGPARPDFKGKTLTFTRTNWEPTEDDDIVLFWGYKKYSQRG